ncbi:MAG: hypothetical protein IJ083_16705 [Clostridia bacterium]|nr:hypothetical protein [Clostridia bacterium]
MKDREVKVHAAMLRQIERRGFASPVDVFIDLGVLEQRKVDEWRAGRVPVLENVCHGSLAGISAILREMRRFGEENGWKASYTCYQHKGFHLRFTRHGTQAVELAWATHFVKTDSPVLAKKAARKHKEAKAHADSAQTGQTSSVSGGSAKTR